MSQKKAAYPDTDSIYTSESESPTKCRLCFSWSTNKKTFRVPEITVLQIDYIKSNWRCQVQIDHIQGDQRSSMELNRVLYSSNGMNG